MIARMRHVLVCLALGAAALDGLSQSNAIFNGGVGDGHASYEHAQASATAGVFVGGHGDGYASIEWAQAASSSAIFKGGIADGHAVGEFVQASSTSGIFSGGLADGYAGSEFAQASSSAGIFNGGNADGWADGEGTNVRISISGYLFLEGPYDPGQELMSDALRAAGLVPLTEPFTAMGYAQMANGGGETTSAGVLATTGSDAVVDWVRLELRSATDPSLLVATRQALVLRDGTIVGGSGGSPVLFDVPSNASYFVVMRHRNHLGVMTASPIAFAPGITTAVDLRYASGSTFGTDARKTAGSVRLLWAGDVNADGSLKYTGNGNDRDPILVRIGGTVPTSTVSGYWAEDVNMDASVKYTGSANDRDPILVNIGGTVPTNIRTEQVP